MKQPVLTSSQNPLVKYFIRLRENKAYRKEQKRTLVSGLKLIDELGRAHTFTTLIVQEGFDVPAHLRFDRALFVSHSLLKKITGLPSPEPLAAELRSPETQDVSSLPYLLVLDEIADPGNLGALFRTALALRWDGVFLTQGSADPLSDKALRAAKGASFFLPWAVGSHEDLKNMLNKRRGVCLVADAKGKELERELKPPLALVLGNEAHGPAPFLKDSSSLVGIPLNPQVESLNVAVAGGILMHAIKGAR